jgi:surface polysaccharide O-acyltransferase-like enzyme
MNWQLSHLLRAIAMTLVIAIHASASWCFGGHGNVLLDRVNPEIFLNTLVNQVGRFTVPLFVILSGFALARSEESRPFSFTRFWHRRAIRILPPYIFFSIANIAFRPQFQSADWIGKLNYLWQVFQDGSADYHLYFLVIIIQCYMSYPLLRLTPFSNRNLALLGVLTISLFTLRWLISLFGLFGSIAPFVPDSNHWIFWLPYFLLGIWLAKEPDWFAKCLQSLPSTGWGCLWAIASIIEVSEFYFGVLKIGAADPVGHYGRPTVVLMTISFLLWAMSWQYGKVPLDTGVDLTPQPKRMGAQIVETIGNSSFSVFLTHVWVLRLISPLEVVGGIAYLFIATIASWGIGIFVWQRLRSFKGLNLILGA